MKKVLVIAGPTASGKTSLSISLAKEFQAQIISGDSIQVYKGLDIGSGKIKKEEMDGIPHRLIDILEPKQSYSVADFQKQARYWIEKEDCLSMIVGGTGLYLKACLYDYSFEENEIRVDASLEEYSNEQLYEMLQEVDPLQATKIHPNNRRRLLRSLTIAKQQGKGQSEIEAMQKHEMIYDCFIVGCTMERELLHRRIEKRVRQMFEDGLEEEIKQLLKDGVTFEDSCFKGIGYKEWEPYFKGECARQEVFQAIIQHSRQYARRQYTWFHHQMPVHWVDMTKEEEIEQIKKEIREWLEKN